MAIPLSTYVRSDEFIVKQPRVALTNSTSTMPVKTRPLDDSPVWPLPNNIGETGSYPYIASDETPVGDERTGTTPPPDYAVEYMVWISDEGSGINVSSEETFEIIDGWTATDGASGLSLTTRDPQQGLYSLRFNKTVPNVWVGVEKLVYADYSAYTGLNVYFNIYLPATTDIDAVEFYIIDSSGNQRSWEDTSLSIGWNTITCPVDTPNMDDDPGFDLTDVEQIRFRLRYNVAATLLNGIELDNFKGTEILPGKIASGDIEISYARNSAWQTKFEYEGSLNRWILISYTLGTISNSPRLSTSTEYINDYTQRNIDFLITVGGTVFTVTGVANEAAFGSPISGTVEYARSEGTFNFNTADLTTYTGESVIYTETADGTALVNTSGVASLERGLTITFEENPVLSNKDISLNHQIVDAILASELSGINQINLSFTPIGSTSLRYDPVPTGYPNPLVEGTDYIIDIPAIIFTSSSSGEYILSDFDLHPQNPGDPDSSQNVYESVGLDHTNVVPNTLSVTKVGVGTLTEDQDFLVDLVAGQIYFTHGYQTETIVNNMFIEDTAFVDTNFNLYINAVEQSSYKLIPTKGWIILDTPLYAGDVVTVSYTSGSTTYTGDYVYTPSVVIPSIDRTSRLITHTDPADGGETSFTVQHVPITLTQIEIDAGDTTINLTGDRTSDYYVGILIKLNEDIYVIDTSVYTTSTTITLKESARRSYVNPTAYYTKNVVSWATITAARDDIPNGVSTITLKNEISHIQYYYAGIMIRIDSKYIYTIKGVSLSGNDVILSLTQSLRYPISTSVFIDRSTVRIPTEGDDTVKSFYMPILDIPNRYDGSSTLMTLEDRFTGMGTGPVTLIRNGVDLTYLVDYDIDLNGNITLKNSIVSTDTFLILKYLAIQYTDIGDEYTSSYTYYSNSPIGVGLKGTMTYQVPDTFYFRVVNNTTQANIFRTYLTELMRQKSGQVSVGASPVLSGSTGNHTSGLETPVTRVGDFYDNDIIAQRIYDFLSTRIGHLESEKLELCGEIPGGYGGGLTGDDLEESARGTGRLFPINAAVLLAIIKKGQEIALPARPYRLPVMFGLPTEDDFSRLVLDEDYPTIPVVTYPPYPPQGEIYKGSNQEPNAFGILGSFGSAYAASAPTTFVENWYPTHLDQTYVNPITLASYTDYAWIPAVIDTDVLDVVQDTGDPGTSTPVFPPFETELDPVSFAGFDVTVFPLSTYQSVAPRSIPKAYEGMAIGALYDIDTEIEATTLRGTSHRQIIGDPNSYPDFLGWVYKDNNEYDLLTNGTNPETSILQAEWLSGARPHDLAAMTNSAKQQILVLTLEKESLVRQETYLTNLIAQIIPSGDPEQTTVDQATIELSLVQDAITDVDTALTDIQTWYTDIIVTQTGVATDEQIRARWEYITGVDTLGIFPPIHLPTTPTTMDGRIPQVTDRIAVIISRLKEINNTLGFDNTVEPNFTTVSTSEDLYTQRYTFLDIRVNRESGTLFKALSAHAQYVKNVAESQTLLSLIGRLGG